MNIASALNKKYIPYTVVMLTSVCENNPEHVDAYLFNSELDDGDFDCIRKALSAYDISVHPVNVDRKRFNDRLPRNNQWSIEMYYRLLATELLPQDMDRLLYLDVDLVVDGDLRELYYGHFKEAEIIVFDDKGGKNIPSSYGKKHQEMFAHAYSQGYRYFNSGVMLLNLKLLRERYTFDTYLDAIREWNYEMEAPDQDILNWVHWKNVRHGDFRKYDYFARVAHNDGIDYEAAKRDIVILHFAGDKPWNYSNFHYDLEKIWWYYAKLTPFYWDLLEAFIHEAMTDNTVENYLDEITEINRQLSESLNDVLALLKKHMGNM